MFIKVIFGPVLLIITTFTIGCAETPRVENKPNSVSSETTDLSIKTISTNSSTLDHTLIIAQKEYQKAYDVYVKMLRESGPQTLETLNALADYQKKYQIYQMLLNVKNSP